LATTNPKLVDELPSIQNGIGAIMGASSLKLKHSPNKHMSCQLLCVLILKMPLSLGNTQHNALPKQMITKKQHFKKQNTPHSAKE
jgi:hypothetical protein